MQRQQNRTRECVHVITDLAQLEKKNEERKRKRKRRERIKTSTREIMYIKKKTQQEERFKKQTSGV